MDFRIETICLCGDPVGPEDPLPYFGENSTNLTCEHDGTFTAREMNGFGIGCAQRILPYRMQNTYGRTEETVTLQTIVLENEFLRAVFLPECGGKLWSLFNKEDSRELLFSNKVFRPANLAVRNAWISGGIEWNLGHTGHGVFTCAPVYCAKVETGDECFLRVYEYEAISKQFFQIDFHLRDGERMLTAHVRIENAQDVSAPLYWWSNSAVPLTENTRIFSHSGEIIYRYPQEAGKPPKFGKSFLSEQTMLCGVDISYPARLPLSFEYFFQNEIDFVAPWEVSIEKDGKGFLECSTQPLRIRKMFCWGNCVGGDHWCDHLSEPGKGRYIELQAGLAPTQLHTILLQPGEAVDFTQVFGPFFITPAKKDGLWQTAKENVEAQVNRLYPAERLKQAQNDCRKQALIPATKVLFCGSFYGGLERARCRCAGEIEPARHLWFPLPDNEDPAHQWICVLEGKPMEEVVFPAIYQTDHRWLEALARVVKENPNSIQTKYQYAVSLAENGFICEAICLLRQINDPWSMFALGKIAMRQGDDQTAQKYLLNAYDLEQNGLHSSFAEAALEILIRNKEYRQAWSIYHLIPEELRTEEETLLALKASLEIGEFTFARKALFHHYSKIREGDTNLSDLWFEFQGRISAQANGIPFDPLLIDRNSFIPYELNFITQPCLYQE